MPPAHVPEKPDSTFAPIVLGASHLMELFDAHLQRLEDDFHDEVRKAEERITGQTNTEISELRQTVLLQKSLIEQLAWRAVAASDGTGDENTMTAGEGALADEVLKDRNAAEEVLRIIIAIKTAGLLYADGSVQLNARSAQCTNLIVRLFRAAVERFRESGIKSEHLDRSNELLLNAESRPGSMAPNELWEILELMELLPKLYQAAEEAKQHKNIRKAGP